MNYTLHQLHVFLRVARVGSVTKAAESLHLTQPAVSIQLRNFQDHFDIPLTEVVGRKLFVTDFGREIAAAAEKILNEVQAIDFKSNAYKGELTGRLTLTVVSTAKYVMPFFLADFIQQHPGITLQMDVTNKSKVIRSLERNEVDFSLVSILPNLNTENIPLMPNQLFLVGNTAREFPEPVYPNSLIEELPLIYREPGSGTRQTMERYLEDNKLNVTKKMELTSNEAVKQSVIAGLGYSILPLIGLRAQLTNQTLQIIPVAGLPVTSTWHLIWLKGKQFSPVARYFLEYIEREKERIIAKQFGWSTAFAERFDRVEKP